MKGQVSAEFASILAVQLLLIALIMVIFSGIVGQAGIRSQYIVGHDSVMLLSDAARQAWSEGPGAMSRVVVSLPQIAQLNRSNFDNNTIDLYLVGFGDVTAALPFQIQGNWPQEGMPSIFDVYNDGSFVQIRPALLASFNLSSYYAQINKSSSNASVAYIKVSNSMNHTYNVTAGPNPCSGAIACVVSPASTQQISPFGYSVFNITLDATSNPAGIYSGYVNFTFIGNESFLPNKTFTVPVTALVHT